MPKRLALLLVTASLLLTAQTTPQPPRPAPDTAPKTYTLPPDKLQKAIDYGNIRNRLHFIEFFYGVAVLAAILKIRIAPRFRDWAEAASSRRIVQAYVFAPLIVAATDIPSLPFELYRHHIGLKYEQSVQGWGSWFWDWTKGELLACALAGLLAWILYAAIRRSPRRWWFHFWLVAVPIVLFIMLIEPVVIEPMFFKFEPLEQKHPALVSEIAKVTRHGGLDIPASRMFEMNASEKLNSLNAYVAGIGASKRVVVWDTTIRKMTTPEILFVFGHEMGHYVLQHIWMGVGVAVLVILLFLYLGYRAMRWALDRWAGAWSIAGVEDWASMPVLLLAVAIFSFVSEPLMNTCSRMLEHNADIYGLEAIHGIVPNAPEVAAHAFQVLGEVSLDDPNPNPFVEIWIYNHPAISDRVRFASQYDPWSKGQPPKYIP